MNKTTNQTYVIIVTLLSLVIPCTAGLIGPTWTLASLRTNGAVLKPQDGETYTLSFKSDKTVSGIVNCNTCIGTYVIDAVDTGSIDLAICTDMACQASLIQTPYETSIAGRSRFVVIGNSFMLYGADTLYFTSPATKTFSSAQSIPASTNRRAGKIVTIHAGMGQGNTINYDCHGRQVRGVEGMGLRVIR